MEPSATLSPTTPSPTKTTLRLYLKHTLRHKRDFVRALAGVPIAQFVEEFAVPFFLAKIMTILAVAQKSGDKLTFDQFMPWLIAITVAEIFHTFFWKIVIVWVWRMEELAMRDLNNTAFQHLLRMSQHFFANRFGGSLVSQVNKFVGAYERLADTLIWNVYKLIISFTFTVAILVKPAPLYVSGLVLFSGLYVVIVYFVKKRELPYNEVWANAETRRTGQLADSITNISAVKSFAHEKLEAIYFSRRAQAVTDASLKTMKVLLINELYSTGAQRLINFSAIFTSLLLAVNGNVNVGLIFLILSYTRTILGRLWDLNSTFRNLNRVFGDTRDMTEILGIEPDVKDPDHPEKSMIHRGQIEFEAVTFQHGGKGIKIFNKLSMRIKPGEKIGLVGPSGSGKTTLTQLLLRLMDVQKGRILIDGQDITHITQEELRAHIAYVPQESLLFHRSLRDNIRYGQLDASDEAVRNVATMAHADEFIKRLPQGMDTMVGERGTKLSGGQRQRVSIARAMLKNAPILVLDEATSALDSESEVLIQDALWKLMEHRTAIVIAHRLSTIQQMDRILVLDKGVIVEEGSHKELIHRQGVYAKLWAHQSGGFIEE